MLDIWVDIITAKILNLARDGYGLDTRLHNDYVDEIKKRTKDYLLRFLAGHDAEIRRQTIDEVIEILKNNQEFGMISAEEKYANAVIDRVVNRLEQMKGEL